MLSIGLFIHSSNDPIETEPRSPSPYIVTALLGMLHAFKKSKQLRISVKAQQALLREGEDALQIINVVETRWNSVLYAGRRILLLHKCIEPFIPLVISTLEKSTKFRHFKFTEVDYWFPLKSLLDFLLPYQIATDVLQSDASSLADVHSQFASLITAANSLVIPHPLAGMREELVNIIRGQWNDHVNHDIVITCSFLSHDPRYFQFNAMEKHEASHWFEKWGVKFLTHYRLSESGQPLCYFVPSFSATFRLFCSRWCLQLIQFLPGLGFATSCQSRRCSTHPSRSST